MNTATLTQLATANAYENRLAIIETIAGTCEPLCNRYPGTGLAIEHMAARRGRLNEGQAYQALAAIITHITALAPAAENDDAAASYEVQLLVLLEHALLISIARSPAEIVTLAEDAEERMALVAAA